MGRWADGQMGSVARRNRAPRKHCGTSLPICPSAHLPILLLLACSSPVTGHPALVVIDDAGDTVALAAPARRVVSLIPATTEILFAIGAGPELVGRTKWCDYPAAAARVTDVGDGITPSLESILAQRPDLVVLYRSRSNVQVADHLRSLGVPVVQLSIDRLADVPRVARMLGQLTGHVREADSVSTAMAAALVQAASPPSAHPVKVLILAWDQPPITIGAGSFLSEIVERAGGINLFADVTAPSAPVSIEAIVSRNPDVILTTSENQPAFANRPEWRVVPAVRAGRYLRVAGSAFSRPSPRAPDAIRDLEVRLSQAGRQ